MLHSVGKHGRFSLVCQLPISGATKKKILALKAIPSLLVIALLMAALSMAYDRSWQGGARLDSAVGMSQRTPSAAAASSAQMSNQRASIQSGFSNGSKFIPFGASMPSPRSCGWTQLFAAEGEQGRVQSG